MKRCVTCLSVVVSFLLVSLDAHAVELAYKWKKGASYRFSVTSKDDLAMTGMGVTMNKKFATSSTFSLAIDQVRQDGVAEGALVIESFTIKDDKGAVMATVANLPKNALRNDVEIDPKGNFTFKQVIYLVVQDDGNNLLVSGTTGATGASASAQDGDEKVSVYAEFDPKTGQLRAGYKAEKIEKPTKTVAVKKDAPEVDLVPRQFLEMLRLPEGNITAGQQVTAKIANYTIGTTVKELNATTATLLIGVRTEKAPGGDNSAPAAGPMGMPNMGAMGMPAMPAMGGTGEGDAEGAGAAEGNPPTGMPSLSIDGDFTLRFDLKEGMFAKLDGTLKVKTNVQGMMSMQNSSTVAMARAK